MAPEVAHEDSATGVPEPIAADADFDVEDPTSSVGDEDVAAAPEPLAAEGGAEDAVVPQVAPTAPSGPAGGPSGPARETKPGTGPSDAGGGQDKKGKQRKRVREVVNLQEQEQFARQITSRGRAAAPRAHSGAASEDHPRARRRQALAEAVSGRGGQPDPRREGGGDISVGELASADSRRRRSRASSWPSASWSRSTSGSTSTP